MITKPHSDEEIPRGIRNNNPGNIRSNHFNAWVGQCGTDTEGMCVFKSPVEGLNALARLLRVYHDYHADDTIRMIITRFAPSNENDTKSYIEDVSKRMKKSADVIVNFPSDLPALMQAIIYHENGQCPYDDAIIRLSVDIEYDQ